MDLLPNDKVIFNVGAGNWPKYFLGTIKDIIHNGEDIIYNIVPSGQMEVCSVKLNKILGRSTVAYQVGQIPLEEVYTFLPKFTKHNVGKEIFIFKEGFNAAVIKMDILMTQLIVKTEYLIEECANSSNNVDLGRVPFLNQRLQDLITLKTQLPKIKT